MLTDRARSALSKVDVWLCCMSRKKKRRADVWTDARLAGLKQDPAQRGGDGTKLFPGSDLTRGMVIGRRGYVGHEVNLTSK